MVWHIILEIIQVINLKWDYFANWNYLDLINIFLYILYFALRIYYPEFFVPTNDEKLFEKHKLAHKDN